MRRRLLLATGAAGVLTAAAVPIAHAAASSSTPATHLATQFCSWAQVTVGTLHPTVGPVCLNSPFEFTECASPGANAGPVAVELSLCAPSPVLADPSAAGS